MFLVERTGNMVSLEKVTALSGVTPVIVSTLAGFHTESMVRTTGKDVDGLFVTRSVLGSWIGRMRVRGGKRRR